jgi:predicted phosphohydrolase
VADNLIICGDIRQPSSQIYKDFFHKYSTQYDKIFMVTGNHEYYHARLTIDEINDSIHNIMSQYHNVIFLNNLSYIVSDIRIIGTTLWTNPISITPFSLKNGTI